MPQKDYFSKAEKPKIARAYIRVSLQGDRGRGKGSPEFVSPDMQLSEARKYAEHYFPGWTLDEEESRLHQDIDRSASRLPWKKREGLVAHLEDARRGEYGALIFFKLSRFARNVREGLELFEMFEEAGISLHSVREEFINTKGKAGKFVLTMFFAIAEMESDNTSDFVSATFLRRVETGKIHGKTAFWIDRNEDGSFSLNDRAAEIRRLVELRLGGQSYTHTAKILNAEGSRSQTGVLWTMNKVKYYMTPDKIRLLQGHFVYGTDREEDDERRVILRDVFPAVISQEEAEALIAYNRRTAEFAGDGNPRRSSGTTYVVSGVVWCSQCGGRLSSRNSDVVAAGGEKRRKSSYMCEAAETNNVAHPVGYTVSAEILEDAVLRVVRHAMADRAQLVMRAAPQRKASTPVDTAIERKIAKLDERVLRLVAAYDEGDMRREDYQRRYRELDDQREALKKQLSETDSEASVRLAMEQAAKLGEADDLTKEQARMLVMAWVERVEAPINIDCPGASKGSNGLPRAARVTLRLPLSDGCRTFIAPTYNPQFKGERVVMDAEAPAGHAILDAAG